MHSPTGIFRVMPCSQSITPPPTHVRHVPRPPPAATITAITACSRPSCWSSQARNIASNEYVALKEVTIDPEEGTPPTAIREIAYVKSLRNLPNVVQLLDIIYSETKITLVLELCKQDLKRFMDGFRIPGVGKSAPTPQPLPNDIAKDFAYQLLCGVQSLHENRIIHRDLKVCSITYGKIRVDRGTLHLLFHSCRRFVSACSCTDRTLSCVRLNIKPQNILLTENNILKIGDFGLARSFGPPTSTYSNEVCWLAWIYRLFLMGLTARNRLLLCGIARLTFFLGRNPIACLSTSGRLDA